MLFTLGAIELGYWLGKVWQRRVADEKESSVGALAGASLGRFDNRRQLVVREANAIGTTNLRAGYLDEPHRQGIRDLLRQLHGMAL